MLKLFDNNKARWLRSENPFYNGYLKTQRNVKAIGLCACGDDYLTATNIVDCISDRLSVRDNLYQ